MTLQSFSAKIIIVCQDCFGAIKYRLKQKIKNHNRNYAVVIGWQGRREFLKELFYAQNGKNIAKNAEKQAKNRKLCPIKNEISKFFRFFSGNL